MKKMSKTVVFFGNEKLATGISDVQTLIKNAVQAAGFEIEKVITGPLQELGAHSSQLAVLAAYGRIMPQSVLDQFPLGVINIHPSLLPLYRGTTPIEQVILDGATKTGVSIMRLTAGMDEGPLYKQKSLHLRGDESKAELAESLQRLGAELLTEVLPKIATQALPARNQPHPDRATYSRKLTKDEGNIDWTKPALQLEREVRAFAGWPKSRTIVGNKEVIITAAHFLAGRPSQKPGAVEVINKSTVQVACGTDYLIIDKLKPADKSEMSAAEFIRGYGQNL